MNADRTSLNLAFRMRDLLSIVVGAPCLHVTLGTLLLTEWGSRADAQLAARYFLKQGRRGTAIGYSGAIGWNVTCELNAGERDASN